MTPFGHAELSQLTQDIWTGMLGIPICPDDSSTATLKSKGDGTSLLGCVHISGAWEGAVVIDCALRLARKAAAAFLGVRQDEIPYDQVRDAVGELANMSAGSLKPLVPGPSHISLPSVVAGTDYQLTIPKGHVAAEMRFVADGDVLVLSVLQADRKAKNTDAAETHL
jgi:chemotaxis protein CheX